MAASREKKACGGTSSLKNNLCFIDEKRFGESLAKSHSSSGFAVESTVTTALSSSKNSVYL